MSGKNALYGRAYKSGSDRGRRAEAAKWILANTRAAHTAKWATTMTRVAVAIAAKARKSWVVVGFPGPGGRESRGIVDLLAIRRDHTLNPDFERGDLFEIVLIQVKGGSAPWPTTDDLRRLRAVQKRYRARDVLLAQWRKGRAATFFALARISPSPRRAWEPVDPAAIFW